MPRTKTFTSNHLETLETLEALEADDAGSSETKNKFRHQVF